MKIRSALIPTAALAIGLVVGLSSTSQADPVVQTITKRVPVEKIVEVEKEVEVEVPVTPQACLDVIDYAEQMAGHQVKFIDQSVRMNEINSQWPDLVLEALDAGVNMDVSAVEGITADIEGMTSDMGEVNRDLQRLNRTSPALIRRFNSAKSECASH